MAFQDFDLITQRRNQERQRNIKKRIMIGLTSAVVIVLIVAAAVCAVTYQKNQNASTEGNTSTEKNHAKTSSSTPKTINVSEKAVKTVCASTDYEKTCEDSLKTVKSNATSQPIDVFRATFASASKEIDRVIAEASKLKIEGPFKKAAFDDCLVLLKDAKEELNFSISSLKGKDMDHISAVKPELNNWLSAVLSYQQTCVDGFPDGPEKDSLQKLMKTGKELGSNALAIVSQISSIFAAFNGPSNAHRRLAEGDEDVYADWMDDEHRRMLKADASKFTPNVTVAKDKSGNFTTIAAALKAMPEKYTGRYVIFVKEGVYDESEISFSRTGRRVPRPIPRIQKHRRPRKAPGRGPSCPIRPVHLRQLQNGRVPGHPVRPNPPAVLPELLHHRHNRFHLRRRGGRVPELLDLRAQADGQPADHRDGAGEARQEGDDGDRDPEEQDPRRRQAGAGEGEGEELLGAAVEGVLEDGGDGIGDWGFYRARGVDGVERGLRSENAVLRGVREQGGRVGYEREGEVGRVQDDEEGPGDGVHGGPILARGEVAQGQRRAGPFWDVRLSSSTIRLIKI